MSKVTRWFECMSFALGLLLFCLPLAVAAFAYEFVREALAPTRRVAR